MDPLLWAKRWRLPFNVADTGYGHSAREVAAVAMALGAGRERKDDPVDHAVGIVCLAKRGDRVGRGEPLAEIQPDLQPWHGCADVRRDVTVADLLPAVADQEVMRTAGPEWADR